MPSEIFGVYLPQSLKTGLLSLTSVINTTTTAVLVWIVRSPFKQQDPSSTAVTFNSYLSRSSVIGFECNRITPVISSITNWPDEVPPPTKPNLRKTSRIRKHSFSNSELRTIYVAIWTHLTLSPSLSDATTVVTNVFGPAFSSTFGV